MSYLTIMQKGQTLRDPRLVPRWTQTDLRQLIHGGLMQSRFIIVWERAVNGATHNITSDMS